MNPSPKLVITLLLEVEQLRQEVQATLRQAATIMTKSRQIAEQTSRIHAEVTQVITQVARTLALLRKQRQQSG